jgi:hypothetical protein
MATVASVGPLLSSSRAVFQRMSFAPRIEPTTGTSALTLDGVPLCAAAGKQQAASSKRTRTRLKAGRLKG